MNRLATLFSSSSGNCTLISNDDTNILIDAGVSASRVISALGEFNLDICEIDGILVTHEHTDHIKSVGVLSRKYNIPVYANEPTMKEIIASVGDLHDRNIVVTQCGHPFDIRSVNVMPFSIPHDAVSPMGYTVNLGNNRVSVATDTGNITKSMLVNMSKSDAVLIEANHDVDMVKNSKYPYSIKKRILSDTGHLSNENAAWLATQLALWGTKKIILGHISCHNNIPELAYSVAQKKLNENNIHPNRDVILKVAQKAVPCIV